MNIPIWILVLGGLGLPIVGFLVCALFTGGRLADEITARMNAEGLAAVQKGIATINGNANRRNQSKLSAIRDLLDTPRTIRKGDVRNVLDGEVA